MIETFRSVYFLLFLLVFPVWLAAGHDLPKTEEVFAHRIAVASISKRNITGFLKTESNSDSCFLKMHLRHDGAGVVTVINSGEAFECDLVLRDEAGNEVPLTKSAEPIYGKQKSYYSTRSEKITTGGTLERKVDLKKAFAPKPGKYILEVTWWLRDPDLSFGKPSARLFLFVKK